MLHGLNGINSTSHKHKQTHAKSSLLILADTLLCWVFLFHINIKIWQDWIWDWVSFVLSNTHKHTHTNKENIKWVLFICSSHQCGHGPLHNTGKIPAPARLTTDFLHRLAQSSRCLLVLLPRTLFSWLGLSLLTSHLYSLKQTRHKGNQHRCANEKNADLDFSSV